MEVFIPYFFHTPFYVCQCVPIASWLVNTFNTTVTSGMPKKRVARKPKDADAGESEEKTVPSRKRKVATEVQWLSRFINYNNLILS